MKSIEIIKIEEARLKETIMIAIKQFEEVTELSVATLGLISHREETISGFYIYREIDVTYNTQG